MCNITTFTRLQEFIVITQVQAVAVDTLTQDVEELLNAECPALYRHLVKVLSSHSSQSKESVCHERLKKIIYQHVRRMFVGKSTYKKCGFSFSLDWLYLQVTYQWRYCATSGTSVSLDKAVTSTASSTSWLRGWSSWNINYFFVRMWALATPHTPTPPLLDTWEILTLPYSQSWY